MESFYGGRPGTSFIIVKSFPSIKAMKDSFSQGMNYNEVYFDEYVIINNPNNASQNGKVFRRGYDFSNNMGGAEQICQIQGPAGPPLTVELLPYEGINLNQIESPVYGNQSGDVDVLIEPYNGKQAIEYIPGKEVKNNQTIYNDNIYFRYYQVEDSEHNQSLLKIGFKIPYPVFDFSVNRVGPTEQFSIQRTDNKEHNFYSKWQLNIPFSAKGDSITKIEIVKLSNSIDNPINNENIDYSWYSGSDSNKKASDMEAERPIIVATIENYDENNNPTQTQYYVADFDLIQNIDINDNGYFIFTINGKEISSTNTILPVLNNITLSDNGQLSMEWYNADGSKPKNITLDNEIKWVKKISVEDGNFYTTWNTQNKEKISISNTKLITDLKIIDGVLCQRHLGIDEQKDTSNDKYAQDPDSSNYYKKIFNIRKEIQNVITNEFAQFQNKTYYTKGTYIEKTINTELQLIFNKNAPNATNFLCQLSLEKYIPSNAGKNGNGIIQTGKMLLEDRANGRYNTNCIKKIYLTPPENSILETIYSPENQDLSERWENLNYETALASEHDETGIDETKLNFYSGSSTSGDPPSIDENSKTAFCAIVPSQGQSMINEGSQLSQTIRKAIIKDLFDYALTGKERGTDLVTENISRHFLWRVSENQGGLKLELSGSSGSDHFQPKFGYVFTIPVTIEIELTV